MIEAVKIKWLEALRSGEYEQTSDTLKDRNTFTGKESFCCLGVLCELAVKEEVIPEPWENGYIHFGFRNPDDPEIDYSSTELPKAVAAWAGLEDTNPGVTIPTADDAHFTTSFVHLAEANDGGQSFEEIADLIEKYL